MARSDLAKYGTGKSSAYIVHDPPELRGTTAARTYQRIRDTDPVVGSVMLLVESVIKRVEWRAKPNSLTPDDARAIAEAEFLDSCLHDMEDPWSAITVTAMSMLTHGWCVFEELWKFRRGPTGKPETNSRFTDGRLGLRNLDYRPQTSLLEWQEDQDGKPTAMRQSADQTYTVPLSKCLYLRTTHAHPYGRSFLRNVYRPFYFQTKLEEIEAIGVERDLAGIPKAEVPLELLQPRQPGETDEQYSARQSVLRNIEENLQALRQDQRAYVIFPAETTFVQIDNRVQSVPTGYKFGLISAAGTRAHDTDKIIRRYGSRIAQALLAEFIMLGIEKSGSEALSTDKTKLFLAALSGILDSIADEFNRVTLPKLMQFNGVPPEYWPTLEHGSLSETALQQIAEALASLANAGFITPDDPTEAHLRMLAGLPAHDPATARRQTPEPAPPEPTADQTGDQNA